MNKVFKYVWVSASSFLSMCLGRLKERNATCWAQWGASWASRTILMCLHASKTSTYLGKNNSTSKVQITPPVTVVLFRLWCVEALHMGSTFKLISEHWLLKSILKNPIYAWEASLIRHIKGNICCIHVIWVGIFTLIWNHDWVSTISEVFCILQNQHSPRIVNLSDLNLSCTENKILWGAKMLLVLLDSRHLFIQVWDFRSPSYFSFQRKILVYYNYN